MLSPGIGNGGTGHGFPSCHWPFGIVGSSLLKARISKSHVTSEQNLREHRGLFAFPNFCAFCSIEVGTVIARRCRWNALDQRSIKTRVEGSPSIAARPVGIAGIGFASGFVCRCWKLAKSDIRIVSDIGLLQLNTFPREVVGNCGLRSDEEERDCLHKRQHRDDRDTSRNRRGQSGYFTTTPNEVVGLQAVLYDDV